MRLGSVVVPVRGSAIGAFLTAVAAAMPASVAAQSDSASNAALGRKLMDVCVYDQFRRNGSSEGVASACKCAARRAAPSLQARQIERLQIGVPLTGDVRDEVYKALAACR
ncbi:hypothetical protein [Amorphus orientalis]|uniref:Uncharacterized protein n=1 Tax=Amorphus orientalis TaxID=649198 RepID=A0AAE4AT46_9HYPH|nr:hypothetical protein [Amorphus orientalis]MDQ0315720.1 hypothetical protein [Amorphus orientalis]